MKLKYFLPLTLIIILAWFCRHSVISMLPGEVGISGDLNVCGMVSEPIAVDIVLLASKVALRKDDYFNTITYEAELEDGGMVRATKGELGELSAQIRFKNDTCFQTMNEDSSKKWWNYLEQMSQKIKLP